MDENWKDWMICARWSKVVKTGRYVLGGQKLKILNRYAKWIKGCKTVRYVPDGQK